MRYQPLRHAGRASLILIVMLVFTLSACGSITAGKYTFLERIGSVITILTAGISPTPTTFTADAACQSGEQMIGGGYGLPDPKPAAYGHDPVVIASYPSSANNWHVVVYNDPHAGTVNDGQDFYAFVDCLSSSSPSVGMTQSQANAQAVPPTPTPTVLMPTTTATATAMCPSGTLTSGGYSVNGSVDPSSINGGVTASMPATSGQGWATTIINQDGLQGTPISVTSYALCATQQFVAASPMSQPITWTSQSSSIGEGTASCGMNQVVTGGGFSIVGVDQAITGQILIDDSSKNFSGWRIRANSLSKPPGQPGSILAWVVCINKPS